MLVASEARQRATSCGGFTVDYGTAQRGGKLTRRIETVPFRGQLPPFHLKEERVATFMALITYGDRAKRDEARPKHREYLQKLLDDGNLHESGPFIDDSGAAIIYHAADEAEARRLLENDPYSQAGALADTRIAEWNILFSDKG